MEHTRLGNTGLRISRLALGCMSYGDPTPQGAHRWALADDRGTAVLPSRPSSSGSPSGTPRTSTRLARPEEVVGRAIRRYSRREDIVLATKVYGKMHDGPGGSRPVPQGHPRADRRLPDPARHRLHRPVPDPPLRPRHPGRGDDGGACTTSSRAGKVALPRRVVDVRVAVRQAATRRRPGRLDPVRVHAEPVQPAAPPGRARADGDVRRHGRRPVVPYSPQGKGA